MKWFKHDSNAHRDARIKTLRHEYGITGYGIYWYCIELIAESVDKENVTFILEEDAKLIALEWGLDQLKVQEMMLFMVEIGLFENENGAITCYKLAKRLDDTNSRNPEIRTILSNILGISRRKSEKVGVTSEVSEQKRLDQTRLDQIRSDKKKDHICENSVEISTKNLPPVKIPFKKIVETYHKTLPDLPRTEKLTKTREGYLRQRWINDLPDLSNWENFFDYISQSDFLMGRVESNSDRPPFRATLEWVTKPANYVKIYEGKYHE